MDAVHNEMKAEDEKNGTRPYFSVQISARITNATQKIIVAFFLKIM